MSLSEIDQPEFGALVERYRREIQAHCYRLMGSVHDAEDMAQETFLRAWHRRETYEGRASLRAWLYRIATNVCLDALRKRPKRFVPSTREAVSTLAEPIPPEVREPIWLEPYPDDLLFSDWHNPEEQVSARENISLAFIAALHLLPPRQRAVLILRDVLDWQASEVAALMDTSIAAVKSSLHRARSTLTEHRYRPEDDRALDAERQARLDDYLRAWEAADIEMLVRLLNDDATFSMPPIPSWYRGRETIRGLVLKTVFGGQAQGRWRLLTTCANRQPAFGLYRQAEDHGLYTAYGIQVLTFQHGLIADITTFRTPALFPYFKLPPTLDSAPISP